MELLEDYGWLLAVLPAGLIGVWAWSGFELQGLLLLLIFAVVPVVLTMVFMVVNEAWLDWELPWWGQILLGVTFYILGVVMLMRMIPVW